MFQQANLQILVVVFSSHFQFWVNFPNCNEHWNTRRPSSIHRERWSAWSATKPSLRMDQPCTCPLLVQITWICHGFMLHKFNPRCLNERLFETFQIHRDSVQHDQQRSVKKIPANKWFLYIKKKRYPHISLLSLPASSLDRHVSHCEV